MGFAYAALRLQLIGRQLNLSKINCSDGQSLMISGYSIITINFLAIPSSQMISTGAPLL